MRVDYVVTIKDSPVPEQTNMPEQPSQSGSPDALSREALNIASLDDEIRVDNLCLDLLGTFYDSLSTGGHHPPETVGRLCHGADYFLREFMVADRRQNLLQVDAGLIRRFAAHWYIVRNLEPNMSELDAMLDGITAFYRFLAERGDTDRAQAEEIAEACANRPYYRQRIEDFWAIRDDGFLAWRDEVPL
jgi:hypothetical protein